MLAALLSIAAMPVMAHHSGIDRLVTSAAQAPATATQTDPVVKRAVDEILEHKQNHATVSKVTSSKKERPFRFHGKSTAKMLILGGAEAFPM